MQLQYQLSNGSWTDCKGRADEFLAGAIAENARLNAVAPDRFPLLGRDEIMAQLLSGAEVGFGTNWHSVIRSGSAYAAKMAAIVAARKPAELVACSCGHTVPRASVMSASLGSSCPDCYDSMSA
jgi:hypothetical protein